MSLPNDGPCTPWFTWDELIASCSGLSDEDIAAIDALPDPVKASLIEQASAIGYDLTEHRYPGICTTTKTLCAPCRGCALSPCCCESGDVIDLGRRFAVSTVSEVKVAGVVLTPGTDYRVDDWRWLRRLNDETWPRCVDIDDEDAFSATWSYGREPTAGLKRGDLLFGIELAKKCANLKCELPQRVTTMTREDTTFTIIDSMKMLEDGKTGFYPLDLAVFADKRGRRVKPGMLDPDGHTRRRAIGTG